MKQKSTTGRRAAKKRQADAGRENLLRFRASNPRPALKHGARALATTGELPPLPYAAEVQEQVAALIDAAVTDLGGPETITAMQRQILESSRLALTIVALGARYHLAST